MPLIINTNIASLTSQRNLATNTIMVGKSIERLSSGYRINRAADDAAGLTISETLRSDIRGMKAGLQNAQDGISILQITEGTLSVVQDNLQRIRELTVQATNDTNADNQRNAIESEIKARLQDNQRIVQAAQFNGLKLLTGSTTSARLQIGSGTDVTENTLDISSALMTSYATALGLLGGTTSTGWTTIASIDISTGDKGRQFLNDIDVSLTAVSARRSLIGAVQNALDSAINNLQLSSENFVSSESRIRDLDMASETATLTKGQILQQSSVSVLSQANQAPSLVLSLLSR